jgi:2-polyprenyl-6-methoxyphenol hydroxylase-like FAD-dependent oxidoreductase
MWRVMADQERVPVLIAGGGPVGLTLAAELGWRGVRCLVVDQGDGSLPFPTANSVNIRSMEHYRRLGIAERIRRAGFPLDYPLSVIFLTRLTGFEIQRVERPSMAATHPPPFSPETSVWCPKHFLDPELHAFAASLPGVELRPGHRLERFRQDAHSVTAEVTELATGHARRITASFLVGCDGGGSVVRAELGIRLAGQFAVGQNVAIFFRAPTLMSVHPHAPAIHYRLANPDVLGTIVALDGAELWRLSLRDLVDDVDLAAIDPARCIRQAVGADLPFEVIAVKPWYAHRAVADRFRTGRALLAGDAAHLLEPNGGFGMNTGLGDAADLGWKLAAVLQGWGGAGLLDSYEAERRPIAIRNTNEAGGWHDVDRAVTAAEGIEDDSERGEQVRAQLREGIRRTQQMRFETAGAQLGYVYEPSPICVPDGTLPPPADTSVYTPSARPGSRAPHAWLVPSERRTASGRGEDGRPARWRSVPSAAGAEPRVSTLDLLGRGFTLLRLAAADTATNGLEAAARQRGTPLRVVDLDGAEVRDLYERRLVLVRPDGHVAWRADTAPDDPLALLDRVIGATPSPPAADPQSSSLEVAQ